MQSKAITLLCWWVEISADLHDDGRAALVCCTSSFGSWWRVRIPPRPAEWIGHSESSKVGFSVEAKNCSRESCHGKRKQFPEILVWRGKVLSSAIIIFAWLLANSWTTSRNTRVCSGQFSSGLMIFFCLAGHLLFLLWAA